MTLLLLWKGMGTCFMGVVSMLHSNIEGIEDFMTTKTVMDFWVSFGRWGCHTQQCSGLALYLGTSLGGLWGAYGNLETKSVWAVCKVNALSHCTIILVQKIIFPCFLTSIQKNQSSL